LSARPIKLESETLRREIPALLAVTLLLVMLCMDGYIGPVDGYVLMGSLGLLMYWIAKIGFRSATSDPMRKEYDEEIPSDVKTGAAVGWLILGLAVLLLGANVLVWGAEEIARAMGVSDVIIGLTIVAVGTSLPELAVTLVSALKNEHGLAIGNVIGSNMFNTLAVIGPAAAIHPIVLGNRMLTLHLPVMIGLTLVLFAMTYDFGGNRMLTLHLPVMIGLTLVLFAMTYDFGGRGKLHRGEGLALVAVFAAYHYYTVSFTL